MTVRFCPSFISVIVKNTLTKISLREKEGPIVNGGGDFKQLATPHPSLRAERSKCVYPCLPGCLFGWLHGFLLSYTVQELLPRNGVTHSKLGLPTSVSLIRTIRTDMLIGQPDVDNPLLRTSSR